MYMNAAFWLVDKRGNFYQFLVFSAFSPSEGYLSLGIPYSMVFANTTVLGKYHAHGKIPSLNSLWRHGCNSELLRFLLPTNDKVKKNYSVSRYFEFYRANLNGERKTLKGSLIPIYNAACMPLIYWLLHIYDFYVPATKIVWTYRIRILYVLTPLTVFKLEIVLFYIIFVHIPKLCILSGFLFS